MDLLLATRNGNKTREFAELLGGDYRIGDLISLADAPEIVESGNTFEENAAIKAITVSRLLPGELIIADDSGLEVDALGGAPGVHSARYAGAGAFDRENIEKLIRELQSLPNAGRAGETYLSPARFRCVIAVAKAGKLLATIAGEVSGDIVAPPRGTNGFGYDPVFVPQVCTQTFAELPPEVKNRMSHRARAARKLKEFLKTARP